MTKTEYAAAITTNQTAISAIRTDLRKLRNIEKLAQSFPDLKLVDSSTLTAAVTAKKAELTKLRAELSKARRIVKRMSEIEDIEAGKATEKNAKKPTSEKKAAGSTAKSAEKKADGSTKKPAEKKTGAKSTAKKPAAKPEAKAEQPATSAEIKENPAA